MRLFQSNTLTSVASNLFLANSLARSINLVNEDFLDTNFRNSAILYNAISSLDDVEQRVRSIRPYSSTQILTRHHRYLLNRKLGQRAMELTDE